MTKGDSTRLGSLEACIPKEKGTGLDSQSYFLLTSIQDFETEGSSVNIPWPTKGMGDAEYLWAFQKIVMPIAMEFAPDLVIGKPFPRVRRTSNDVSGVQFQRGSTPRKATSWESVMLRLLGMPT